MPQRQSKFQISLHQSLPNPISANLSQTFNQRNNKKNSTLNLTKSTFRYGIRGSQNQRYNNINTNNIYEN